MQAEERRDLFELLRQLMADVKDAYENWQKQFNSGTPEHNTLTTLIEMHKDIQNASVQSLPSDDEGLEEVANDMRTYMKMTSVHIDALRVAGTTSAGKKGAQVKEYQEILDAREKLIGWRRNVLARLKPVAQAPGATMISGAASMASAPSITAVLSTGAAHPLSSSASAGPLISPVRPGAASGYSPSPPKPDNLFLVLLKMQQKQEETDIVVQTRKLFNQERPTLTDRQTLDLLDAWAKVVSAFSSPPDPNTGLPGRPVDNIEAIISLAVIHSELETLYSELTTNVERTSQDSLDSLLFSLY